MSDAEASCLDIISFKQKVFRRFSDNFLVAATSVDAQTGNLGKSTKQPINLSDIIFTPEEKQKQDQKRAQELGRERQVRERYKGISVKTDPKATGDDHALQDRIAGLLSAMDIVPRQRIECYQWMSKNQYLKITGWYGSILGVTSGPDGKIVTLEVRPRNDCAGGFWTTSHTIERYLFANGKLSFLELVYKGGISTWN
jgi:hypothetical protein